MNVTEEKQRMLGQARAAVRKYSCLAGTVTRIVCDDKTDVLIRWDVSNFAHLCGLEYYADDARTRRLPSRRLYVDLLSDVRISAKRVAPTGDARWLSKKADVIAAAFDLDKMSIVVESGNSRVYLYLGNTVWCIGLGWDEVSGVFYPQSLRKGPAAGQMRPGSKIRRVIRVESVSEENK